MLPESTPYGTGVREIKGPDGLDIDSCEGMLLVRNPKDTAEWGIFYNGKASPSAGVSPSPTTSHFILHRDQKQSFQLRQESVYSGRTPSASSSARPTTSPATC